MAQNRNFKHLVHIWVTEGHKEKMYNLKSHTGMSPGKLFRDWLDHGMPKHSLRFEIELKSAINKQNENIRKQGVNINQIAHQANSYISMPDLPEQLEKIRIELAEIKASNKTIIDILKENL